MIRAAVVDDHRLFADGLSEALTAIPDIEVIATFYDGSELIAAAEELRIGVLIIDLEMPVLDGLSTLEALAGSVPTIVVSMHTGEQELRRSFELGAAAFLPKSLPLSDLAAAVRAVAGGVRLHDAATLRDIFEQFHKPVLDPGAESLTSREKDLLRLLANGTTGTDELADSLYISQKTVKNHLASIYRKLAVSDRAQAVVEAIRLGLHRE